MLLNLSVRKHGQIRPRTRQEGLAHHHMHTAKLPDIQLRKWLLHRCCKSVPAVFGHIIDVDFTDAVVVLRLECRNHVIPPLAHFVRKGLVRLDISVTGRIGQVSSASNIGRCPGYSSRRFRRSGDATRGISISNTHARVHATHFDVAESKTGYKTEYFHEHVVGEHVD